MTGATIFLMMAASAAFGQEFPIYDTNSFCNGVDDPQRVCPKLEEQARFHAEARWTQLESDARQHCIESTKNRSYMSLFGCVEQALAAAHRARTSSD